MRVREADVPIVSEGECVRQINAVTEKIFIMPASSFCAGGEAGNDACQVKRDAERKDEVLVSIITICVLRVCRAMVEVLWSAKMKGITS